MSTLDRAIEIAADAHKQQRDQAGEPYISHPMRVALPFIRSGDETRAIVAVLHDAVEDSDWTLDMLQAEGFAPEIIAAIDALTKREGESYQDFLCRAGGNELARPVKAADIRDNTAPARLAKLPEPRREKLTAKYAGALALLEYPFSDVPRPL